MWLLTMLLALMASTSACPILCECHSSRLQCFGKTAPGELTRILQTQDVTRLSLTNADETEIASYLDNLENSTLRFETLELTNSSLKTLNITWQGLEGLRQLNLSRNGFSRVSDLGDLEHLGNLTMLDVSHNAIEGLGPGVFQSLESLSWLRLRRNVISRIAETAFSGLPNLEYLDLGENKLQVLGPGWFSSLGRLRELDVSRNGLARAAPGALQPLPGLSVLRVAENPIRESDLSLLLGTGRRLETVDASRTGLFRVPVALTPTVRVLRLSGNRITSIRSGDLDSYPLLRLLDLSKNRLKEVEEDALGRLEVLEELDLSENVLPNVPRSLPSALTSLQLDGNVIDLLHSGDLQGLYNLRNLSLRGNNIGAIEDSAFSQLPSLQELDISDNPVKVITANSLSGPNNLEILKMSNLRNLEKHDKNPGDMAFPVQTPEKLITLDISKSPVLAAQLLADDATLSACRSLQNLDLTQNGLTSIRADLPFKIPQLRNLGLSGNNWNCTAELHWLGDWVRTHEDIVSDAKCSSPGEMSGHSIREMATVTSPISQEVKNAIREVNDIPASRNASVEVMRIDPGKSRSSKKKNKRNQAAGEEDIAKTVAEELNRSRLESFSGGAHPGMLVLVGAALGAAATLAFFLSRRASARDRYHRHENIEVHSLTPVTELW